MEMKTPGNNIDQALSHAALLCAQGNLKMAEAQCRQLLIQQPGNGHLMYLLAMTLQKAGRNQEALEWMERASAFQPHSGLVHEGLGFVKSSLGQHSEAAAHYRHAMALGCKKAGTYYSLGQILYRMGRVEESQGCFHAASELDPGDKAVWNNLGKCLADMGRLEEALSAYDRALQLDPGYALAGYGRALVYLARGNFASGFAGYNQWRHHGIPSRIFAQPAWHGEEIPGQTLFLHAEQGFGDAIQHARFLPEARRRVGRLVLECRPELKTLFMQASLADEVIAYGETPPAFDLWASQISLPGLLNVTLESLPNRVPYLKWQDDPGDNARNRNPERKTLRVGLAWSGNPSHHQDASRSITLQNLEPLKDIPGVRYISLQKPVPARDIRVFQDWPTMEDAGSNLPDFLASARLVAGLDLVVTVDTAMAHLAGALGKPVWTLLPAAADWRWQTRRTDSPWYPTMRLFRQHRGGDWHAVVDSVVGALKKFAQNHGSGI